MTKIQLDFGFEDVRIEYDPAVDLDLVDADDVPVDAGFVRNIALIGQIEPVILLPRGKRFYCQAGRRRVKALRLNEKTTVEAKIIYAESEAQALAIGLSENLNRSSNELNEAEMFGRFAQIGFGEKQVMKALGWDISHVRKRRLLYLAPSAVKEGVRTGAIAVGVAERISKLPSGQQSACVEVLAEEGKIRHADVDAVVSPAKDQAFQDAQAQLDIPEPEIDPDLDPDDRDLLRRVQRFSGDPMGSFFEAAVAALHAGETQTRLRQVLKDAADRLKTIG